MNELLANPAVQAALVMAIVVALQCLTAWIKQKFPTQAKLVEDNWCYLQPVVDYAMACATGAKANSTGNATLYSNIVSKAVAEFTASYRKLEGKEATGKEIAAARNEIAAAVARVTGG